MSLIARFLGTIFALLLATQLISGFVIESVYIATIVALILGVINITLKPIVLLVTFPFQILTLGLFTFIVNALFLWFVASFVEGFTVGGNFAEQFFTALIASLLITAVLWILDTLF